MNATCLKCKRTFDASRTDATFCSDICKAAFERSCGNADKHAKLHKTKSKMCEFCGNLFWFNAYADRTGQREPQYCQDKCRIAAWRAKAKAAKEAHENAQRDSRSWDAFRERQSQADQTPTGNSANTHESSDFRDNLVIPRRWNEIDALIWIFGDRAYKSLKEINRAARELNVKLHPDKNGGNAYKHLGTINAAWDYLKRMYK